MPAKPLPPHYAQGLRVVSEFFLSFPVVVGVSGLSSAVSLCAHKHLCSGGRTFHNEGFEPSELKTILEAECDLGVDKVGNLLEHSSKTSKMAGCRLVGALNYLAEFSRLWVLFPRQIH